jgi:hypothetical protein
MMRLVSMVLSVSFFLSNGHKVELAY